MNKLQMVINIKYWVLNINHKWKFRGKLFIYKNTSTKKLIFVFMKKNKEILPKRKCFLKVLFR